MRYAANEGGLCSESEYEYKGTDGTCKSSTCGTKYDANTGYEAVKFIVYSEQHSIPTLLSL